MRASVIIPAYNAQPFIERAVRSLLMQTYKDFEVIIASDDGVDYYSLLKDKGIVMGSLRCVSTGGVGTGLPNARNTALAAASGDFIACLDADDRFAHSYLDVMLPKARDHGVALSQVQFINDMTGEVMNNCSKPYQAGLLGLEDLYSACVHTYAPLVFDRRRIPFNWQPAVPLLEDAVFLAQCCGHIGKAWYSAEPLYLYSHREGSLCNTDDAAQRFIDAGKVIRWLMSCGLVCDGKPSQKHILLRYLERNDRIEKALIKAVAMGSVRTYQEFINRNPDMLHTPLA